MRGLQINKFVDIELVLFIPSLARRMQHSTINISTFTPVLLLRVISLQLVILYLVGN
jgi:hypothetical protein